MRYTISTSPDRPCVEIRVHAPVTSDLQRGFSKEAIEKAAESGHHCFLVDVSDVANVSSTLDQYRLAYRDMARFGLDRQAKIALLTAPGDRSHDFIQTVFTNAGYSCRLFADEASARDWLAE